MQVFIYADNLEIISRWEKILNKKYHTNIISNEEDFYLTENSLLIILASIKARNKEIMVKKLQKNKNLILILDENPSFSKAKIWLNEEVNGYGNAYMQDLFFNSAVETIISGYSWLSPQIAHELFVNISQNKDNFEKQDDIFSNLTSSEVNIAKYLKIGYKNIEISHELNISVNTVKKHIKNIYTKLNVSDRLSLLKLFIQ
ncbi:response regulator transcription factor [Aliarcobacter cryaerophilus]|uniref:Helix-turn-helix transcriptional regulator n=1 Tax=Aliarcobacter cryaerophilus TaxID=28198 RepID=A0A2S9TGF8_9BACT|nr:LuxR C-terminal-related transcriptional regulator [Aliarcobacter cryaerophilus]PRM97925.1 helix-turn-helix transcriptional regulator [Arcobacter cryaerophilus gv. crypticus]